MRGLGFFALVLFACGGDSKTKMDAPAAGDAAHDARVIDAPHPDAPLDGPPGTQLLTVKNYFAWCSVTVNGGSGSIAAQQQVFVLPGDIAVTATPRSGFELDNRMWHHTTGDTAGSGEKGTWSGSDALTSTSSTTATVTGTSGKCVWVCCPFANGTGCDPAVIGEQCP